MHRILLVLLCAATQAWAQSDDTADWFTSATVERGYFDYAWNEEKGELRLLVERFDQEFLYVSALSGGLGSNDIGLDRGQLGDPRVVRFERVGPKVLLVQRNLDYRAVSDDPEEVLAVEQSFAESVVWGFTVAEENDDGVWVDATAFVLRDANDVIGTLKRASEGTYRLDPARSALNFDRTRNFPANTELDALVTFASDEPGRRVRSVSPDGHSVTVHVHHSFVELPDDDYTPRAYDPRAGLFSIAFLDFAAPIDRPIERRWTVRHRLAKRDPSAAISEPVEPIVYYLDRGTPEPVRSALLDGARWWNEAFEAAGYRDAFRVEMLPPDADPLDARYNVIQWVHRSTRGWSNGYSIIDPRTGEIIKGHVTLGSQRVRQDYMIAQGLAGPFANGEGDAAIEALALARQRQLSAHEVGHTLGLAHNFAASANGRVSVMDYPHPHIALDASGAIDLSDAYGSGIGDWDRLAIAYAYQDFPPGTDETTALQNIIGGGLAAGLRFISDSDARPPGSAHPFAHLWDETDDPGAELERVLAVRDVALANFSAASIRAGTPLASLEEILVPIYLLHRYQAEAAVKVIGAVEYSFAVRGDGQVPTALVDPALQRRALTAVLKSIGSDVLTPPEAVIRNTPPQTPGAAVGVVRGAELFARRTGAPLDPLAMAETAANLVVPLLLHPERAARLVEHHARDAAQPSLDQVLDALVAATWQSAPREGLAAEVRHTVNDVVLEGLMALAASAQASVLVRAIAAQRVDAIENDIRSRQRRATAAEAALFADALGRIARFRERPGDFARPDPLPIPPGAPIGWGGDFCSIGD